MSTAGYERNTLEKVRGWIDQQTRRHEARDGLRFRSYSFPDRFCDEALTYIEESTGATLVSVSHQCNEVYDWATVATFRERMG